ncbi:SDR family NAD(P)-dependent oxidoreductase [Alteribacillus sp. HJP-4]|uniref:SDR family NAD(P)-dependent oxidoreductase n=1 Tax=Alteribacillus sp. HJP-4 TaxID=2775394 RepID=UPI0035CCFC04
MEINLTGKTAFVTGAGGGIGKEIAVGLARSGADVIVHYGRNKAGAEAVMKQILELGRKSMLVQGDVRNKEEVAQFFSEIKNHFGDSLDIVINNAGHLVERCSIEEMSEELWHHVIDVNLTSAFYVSQGAIPFLKNNGSGKIINMTSLAAHNGGGPGAVAYAASKGGLMTFTKGLAKELADSHITVNNVSPGLIGETAFHDTFTPDEARKAAVSNTPIKREGTPADVLGAVYYFVSQLGDYVTGETIEVNGGVLMR